MPTFNREILDRRKEYRGDNYINAKNWFNEIEPFKFDFIYPSYDWYTYIDVEIRWNDFDSFTLERRFGNSWWLVGNILYDKLTDRPYSERWERQSIGLMHERDVARFIIWARKLVKNGSSALTTIKALDHCIDLNAELKPIWDMVEKLETNEDI